MLSHLRRWLLRDQIRIAPDEGRLLCLQIGQRVIIDNELFVITERIETISSETPTVRYGLTLHDSVTECLSESPVNIEATLRDHVKIERQADNQTVWMEYSQSFVS
jgi:hypothetical protein